MKIHEYQGKELLKQFGVPVPRGIPALSVDEAVAAADKLGGPVWVVKAQIHAGGRGKGGGVKLARSLEDVRKLASEILGMQLITHQTGPEGQKVRRLYIEDGADIAQDWPYTAGRRRLVIATDGRGFVVPEDDLLASTRKGRNVLNVDLPTEARIAVPVDGDHVAVIGENRKLLVFPLTQIPEMGRGRGVRLQKYKDGTVSDAMTFAMEAGLSWVDSSGRTFNLAQNELRDWLGNRADAGRLPPRGFPKTNRFTPY